MPYRLQKPALLLAALLQLLPLARTLCTNPATASAFAFILRWGIGAGAVLGTVDAVSGATSLFTSPGTFSGTVGTSFSNNVVVSIGGGNKAASNDYFLLSAGSVSSALLLNGQTTTATLPPGLTFTASWVNGASTIGGTITGTPTTAGSYPTTVTIVSPGNASLSQSLTLTIGGSTAATAPAITAQPAASTVIAGNTATFTAAASGTAPVGFFWSKNGTPLANGGNISGVNTATLTIASTTATDAGNYSVLASNAVGTAASVAATLTVLVPPALNSQPAAQTAAAGGSAQFAVTAGGSAPLSYFWLKNGVGLTNGTKFSGVNSNVLTIATVTTGDAGNYSVTVTNLAGSVTSTAAALTVVTSPTITTPPANLSIVAGASATFSVTAAGSAPLAYQWLKNGVVLANGGNVSGSTTATLTLSGVSASDAAGYSVTVTNSLGSVTSPAATLTVAVPPAIVTPPANATTVAGSNVSFTVTASGTAPLTFQWRKNGVNISGATSATLTLVNVSAADAANYSVTVTNAAGSSTSGSATLTVLGPPAITSQPADATVAQGNPAAFTVTATGTAPLVFQWLKNGVALAGATSNVLVLSAVTTNDAGNYSVVVTNIVSSVASSSAALTVLVPPAIVTQPTDASVVAGNGGSFTVTASGTAPLTFQWRKNGVNISGATAATLTLANISAADAANYSVAVTNAAGSATSANVVLTVQSPPTIVTQPANQNTAPGNSVVLTVAATGTAPLTYQWFKGGVALADGGNLAGSATSTLTITALTTNELGTYFVAVSNFLGSVTSANASISVNVAPVITVPPAGQTVAASNTATFTAAATGTGPLAWQWRKNGTNLTNSATVSGATSATLTLANVMTNSSGNYSVIVTNIFGSATSPAATLAVLTPPRITASPTNRVAKTGTNVVFAVTVTGTAPLTYQWFKDGVALADGGNIAGSTTNVLTISALTTAAAGNYSVTVGNAVGSATSSNAVLTILVPPAITTQPASQSVTLSNAVTFSVAAAGTAPLRYQWRKGTAIIAGATNFNFTIASAKTTDAAAYSVVVTNPAGSVTSSNATLTVNVAPVFTVQATNRFAKLGTNTVFRAAASGTAPFNFQWFKDGVALADGGNISGSLSNVLTVANLTTNDTGAYFLTASNAAGSATSSNAVVTVVVPPVIITQPASQSVAVSNAVTFSVAATGTAPLRYQWRKGTMPIAGATNFNYTIVRVKTTDAAAYSVVITNFAGKVTSPNATLTVWFPPVFTLQATNRTATNGTTTVFRAAVKGTAPFSYQWFKDGTALADGGNISGSLSNVLTIANLTTGDAGAYALTAGNPGSSATSSNAVLTVKNTMTTSNEENDHNGKTAETHSSHSSIVAVKAFVAAPPPLQIGRSKGGGFTLTYSGTPGTNYILQAADSLAAGAAWANLSTNTADANGRCQMTDSTRANSRFYRVQTAQ